MPRKIESLFLAGPAGRLEALLEEPDQAAIGIALVCHPHPQHGGTMHNKVVFRVAKGLRRSGHVVMRFNYRGVNLSEGAYAHGEGELEDTRVALDFLLSRYPALAVPTGRARNGVPTSMQIVAPPYRDAVAFEVAYHHAAAARLELYRTQFPQIVLPTPGNPS